MNVLVTLTDNVSLPLAFFLWAIVIIENSVNTVLMEFVSDL